MTRTIIAAGPAKSKDALGQVLGGRRRVWLFKSILGQSWNPRVGVEPITTHGPPHHHDGDCNLSSLRLSLSLDTHERHYSTRPSNHQSLAVRFHRLPRHTASHHGHGSPKSQVRLLTFKQPKQCRPPDKITTPVAKLSSAFSALLAEQTEKVCLIHATRPRRGLPPRGPCLAASCVASSAFWNFQSHSHALPCIAVPSESPGKDRQRLLLLSTASVLSESIMISIPTSTRPLTRRQSRLRSPSTPAVSAHQATGALWPPRKNISTLNRRLTLHRMLAQGVDCVPRCLEAPSAWTSTSEWLFCPTNQAYEPLRKSVSVDLALKMCRTSCYDWLVVMLSKYIAFRICNIDSYASAKLHLYSIDTLPFVYTVVPTGYQTTDLQTTKNFPRKLSRHPQPCRADPSSKVMVLANHRSRESVCIRWKQRSKVAFWNPDASPVPATTSQTRTSAAHHQMRPVPSWGCEAQMPNNRPSTQNATTTFSWTSRPWLKRA
ncbi:hypothetical protein HDK77DRAFT_4781 [Phyllosticta capitalensis]